MIPRPRIGDDEADKMPKGWRLVRLADLVEYEKGSRPSEVREDGQPGMLPYLTVESIRSSRFNQWARDEEDTTRVHRDDIIMIWDGFYSGSVFTGVSGILGSTAVKLAPKRSDVDKGFLYNFLTTCFKELNSKTAGMYLKHVSRSVFESLGVTLPPLPEQRKIAAIFSTVDDVIQKTDEIIAKTQQLMKGLMQELLTRGIGHTKLKQTEIGLLPEEWSVVRFSDISDVLNGRFFPSEEYTESGIRLLRPGNLHQDGFVEWNLGNTRYLPTEYASDARDWIVGGGEIIMNLTAQSLEEEFLGRVCMTSQDEECLLNQRLARITPRNIDAGFLFWVMRSALFRRFVDRLPGGTKVKHIYSRDLRGFQLPFPSLSEQKTIATILFDVASKVTQEKKTIAQFGLLKRSLMQVLLTGKVRVKVD